MNKKGCENNLTVGIKLSDEGLECLGVYLFIAGVEDGAQLLTRDTVIAIFIKGLEVLQVF